MDPFSIGASAGGLAGVALHVGKAIAECAEAIRTARGGLAVLAAEVASLEQTLRAVESMVKRTDLRYVLEKAGSAESKMQQATLSCMLKDCHRALSDLAALLEGIRTNRVAISLLETPMLAWKLNTKSPELGRIQHLVKTYNDGIQIHIQMMQLLVSVDNTWSLQNVDKSLTDIKADILTMRFQMQTFYNQNTVQDTEEETARATIKEYLGSSETLLSSASEYFGSTAGTIPAHHTVVDFPSSTAARVQGWISEVHETKNMETKFDKEDIAELFEIAKETYQDSKFMEAKPFFIKFLDDAQSLGEWDETELHEARLKLVACHSADQQYKEAEELLNSIDQTDLSVEQQSDVEQYRAEVAFMLSDFSVAQDCAKRALSCRTKGSVPYYNLRSLLAVISSRIGEPQYATMYARTIPPDFTPSRIPGWVATDKLVLDTSEGGEDRLTPLSPRSSHNPSSPSTCLSPRSSAFYPGRAPSSASSYSTSRVSPLPQMDWIGTPLMLVGHTAKVNSVSFSPDDERILSASADGSIRVWGSQTGALLKTIEGEVGPLRSAIYSPQGIAILSLSEGGSMQVWNSLYELKCPTVLLEGHLVPLAWVPSGEEFMSVENGKRRYRHGQTGEESRRSASHDGKDWASVSTATFSPSGKWFATGSNKGMVTVSEVKSFKRVLAIDMKDTTHTMTSLVFSADEKYFAASSARGNIWVYETKSWQPKVSITQGDVQRTGNYALSMDISPDGKMLVSGSTDRHIRAWNLTTGKIIKRFDCETTIHSVSISKRGDQVVCGGEDGTIRILELTPPMPSIDTKSVSSRKSRWSWRRADS